MYFDRFSIAKFLLLFFHIGFLCFQTGNLLAGKRPRDRFRGSKSSRGKKNKRRRGRRQKVNDKTNFKGKKKKKKKGFGDSRGYIGSSELSLMNRQLILLFDAIKKRDLQLLKRHFRKSNKNIFNYRLSAKNYSTTLNLEDTILDFENAIEAYDGLSVLYYALKEFDKESIQQEEKDIFRFLLKKGQIHTAGIYLMLTLKLLIPKSVGLMAF